MLIQVLMVMTSCQGSKLEVAVETVNSQCPIDLGDGAEIESLTYGDNTVTMTFAVDESVLDLETLEGSIDELKKEIALQFSESNEGMNEMLKLITENNAKMKFVYKGKKSGTTVECELTSDEIKDVIEKKAKDLAKLEASIKAINASYPQDLGDGLTATKMYIDGDYVVYEYDANEDMVDMAALESNKESIKGELFGSLKGGESKMQEFVDLCVNCKKGVTYAYVGNTTGKKVKIDISCDELSEVSE